MMTTAPAAVADVLDRAADRIHSLGLWQGGINRDGTCTVLALNHVAGTYGRLEDAALDALTTHLRIDLTGHSCRASGLVAWNDTPGRTAAEVCGELRACAAGLRITSDASGYRTVSTYGGAT
jgi:hypothetical protein